VPYSTRFFAGTPASGAQTVYTVPSSYVAVLRDLSAFQAYDGAQLVLAQAVVPGPLTAAFIYEDELAYLSVVHWEGRVVLNAGDALQLYSAEGEVQWVVSGYLLSAP
jgi:hypothetical protein